MSYPLGESDQTTEAIVGEAMARFDAVEIEIAQRYKGEWLAIMGFPITDSAQFASANGL